jgi:hypothetical protein
MHSSHPFQQERRCTRGTSSPTEVLDCPADLEQDPRPSAMRGGHGRAVRQEIRGAGELDVEWSRICW